MITAKFIGNSETTEYKTVSFHAAPGNTVSMPEQLWDEIKSKGDDKLFKDVEQSDKEFKTPRTVSRKRK